MWKPGAFAIAGALLLAVSGFGLRANAEDLPQLRAEVISVNAEGDRFEVRALGAANDPTPIAFSVHDETEYLLGQAEEQGTGRPTSLSDLKVGDQLTITYVQKDGQFWAQRIEKQAR